MSTESDQSLGGLTAFRRDLLREIARMSSPSGAELKSALEDRHQMSVNHGRLYTNLDALVNAGLVEKGARDDRTNEYYITNQARALLVQSRDWTTAALEGAE